ncbi:MAG: glycosyltransferase family 9 protein [Deltaproteobacteria bacterium]|nr:glycosyltransferase family 9 protein [Deltaproteobacteria bacterium]
MIIGDHHTISTDIHNILIIQLGDIGDVVWATPTLWAVKETYPQANVSVLLREGFGCLLEPDPSIYKTFEVKRDHEGHLHNTIDQVRLIKELRQEHFDLVFDLRAGDRGAIVARLTGAPMRASLYYHDVPFWRNMLFTHLLVEPAPPKERVYGAAEQSLRIIRGFGIVAKTMVPSLWVSDQVMMRVYQLLTECNMKPLSSESSHRWITINPFSRWSYKEWAYDKWVSVINWLWDEFQFPTAIVGSKEEGGKASELENKCSGTVYNLAGRTTLAELAGVLSLGSFHIGVDSAAPHIAAAVGTPTIIIYGPSDWRDWAPVGNQHRVVVPDMECVPCYKKGCDGSGLSQCLETLEVETVQKVIQEQIREQAASHC